jgi:hypothetical protein
MIIKTTGDSKLLSGFPWPINGNPDNNLESFWSIKGSKSERKIFWLPAPWKTGCTPPPPPEKKSWQFRRREYTCTLYFFPE